VVGFSDGVEGRSPDSPGDRRLLSRFASRRRPGAPDPPGAEDPLGLATGGVQRMDTLTLSDVVVAILDSRANFPLAASAALIRERDGEAEESEVVHLVLLDEEREPLVIGAGSLVAVTYAARCLGQDMLDAFGDREIIVLK
jgi:hypothetical protein